MAFYDAKEQLCKKIIEQQSKDKKTSFSLEELYKKTAEEILAILDKMRGNSQGA